MSTKKAELTPRQKDILRILAKFSQEHPATVADISKELNISTRTVLREMPSIETWLKANKIQCIRKPGVGLALVASRAQLQAMETLLDGGRGTTYYSKEERRALLLAALLADQEPVKAQTLSKELKIAEGTLLGDLDYATDWFLRHRLTLHRKPGLGVYLTGQESHLRHAMVALVQESLPEMELPGLLSGIITLPAQVKPLLHAQNLQTIHPHLLAVAEEQGVLYNDHGYLTLLLYLSIAMQRWEQGFYLPEQAANHDLPEYQVALTILGKLQCAPNPAETAMVARELVSAIDWNHPGKIQDQWETIVQRQLALRLVEQVEDVVGYTFGQRENLIEDLMRHMENTLRRLKLGISVKNTHIQEIQSRYPKMYQATEVACQLLKESTGAKEISESEVTFIAMYFCAAQERAQGVQRKLNVVLSCPTGVGMSRILEANLSKYCKELDIKGVVSTMRLAPEWLAEQSIDLVISTVKLQLDFPHICVSPALRAQDKVLLKETYQALSTTPKKEAVTPESAFQLRNAVSYLQALGQESIRLVDHLMLCSVEQVDSKQVLIEKAASLFTQNPDKQARIAQDITAREAISETYIDQGQVLLLHCKTPGVNGCHLGYIRLETPFDNNGKIVSGAIVMIIPQDPERVHIEIMGQISAAFLENKGLYLSVQRGEVADFSREVEKVLSTYYRKTLHLM